MTAPKKSAAAQESGNQVEIVMIGASWDAKNGDHRHTDPDTAAALVADGLAAYPA